MNTGELKNYLASGKTLTRFQSVSSSAKRWLKGEVEAGRVWKASDEFGNPRPIYAAPGANDWRFYRAGYAA